MIDLLIHAIILLLIIGVIWWAADAILPLIPLPAPIPHVIRVLLIVLFVVVIIVYVLLPLLHMVPSHL